MFNKRCNNVCYSVLFMTPIMNVTKVKMRREKNARSSTDRKRTPYMHLLSKIVEKINRSREKIVENSVI